MNVKELIELLQKHAKEDMEVWVEGCVVVIRRKDGVEDNVGIIQP